MKKTLLLFSFLVPVLAAAAHAGIVTGTANLVLGQSVFNSTSPATTDSRLRSPSAVAVDNIRNRVFVADTGNHRVLWWNGIDALASGQPASGVLGQANMTTGTANRGGTVAANSLNTPRGISVDINGNLWIADTGNHRVVRYDASALGSGSPAASIVLGQAGPAAGAANRGTTVSTNTLQGPMGVRVDGDGNVWVADTGNNRVLRFSATPSNGMNADLVLGQDVFTSSAPNRCVSPIEGNIQLAVGANTLRGPRDMCFETDGSIWVADTLNHRALVFRGTLASGMDAMNVIGQLTKGDGNCLLNGGSGVAGAAARTCNLPSSVQFDSAGFLWLADTDNNRILHYTSLTTDDPLAAPYVLGQAYVNGDYLPNRAGNPNNNTLCSPVSIMVDQNRNVWVADSGNNRVFKFNSLKVQSLSPTVGRKGKPMHFSFLGEGLPTDESYSLTAVFTHPDADDIRVSTYAFAGEGEFQADLGLTSAATGYWTGRISCRDQVYTRDFMLQVALPLKVTAISPKEGFQGDIVDVSVAGQGFVGGSSVTLSASGLPDIYATNVNVRSDGLLTCRFDLTAGATAYRDVMVSFEASSATLAGAFRLRAPANVRTSRYTVLSSTWTNARVTMIISSATFTDSLQMDMSTTTLSFSGTQSEIVPSRFCLMFTADAALQPRKDVEVTISYSPGEVQGLTESKLVLCLYDPRRGRWIQMPTTVYTAEHKLVAKVRQLSGFVSRFGIFQRVAQRDLGNVIVYPNPYRPDSGTIYGDTAVGKGLVFGNLTPRAHIKIFTIAGELVKELEESTNDGILLWDTCNSCDQKVASGVYIYYITNPDNPAQTAKGRFSIIR